jgi:tRNA 2-thiouridine synthesizing protein B
MPILHTVNKSPFEKDSLDACIAHALDGAAVLLIEDGVYAATTGTSVEPRVRDAMQRLNFFALASDCKARGLAEADLIDGIALVDYGGFVDLVTGHDNVQSWL